MVSPHTRRDFLTYSAQSLVTMPTLVSAPWLLAEDLPEIAKDVTFLLLRPEHNKVLAVLMPMALGVDLNPVEPEDYRVLVLGLKGLDRLIACLPEQHREEVILLLDLLSMPLTRALLALWQRREKSSREEVTGHVDEWEKGFMNLKRVSYQSLVQLMEAAFYGEKTPSLAVSQLEEVRA